MVALRPVAAAALLLAVSLLVSCSDYQLAVSKDAYAMSDTSSEYDVRGETSEDIVDDASGLVDVVEADSGEVSANASINLIFQYSNFGNDAGRCVFDVAFYELAEDDGLGDGGTAQTITMPETAGTCAFTMFDPDDAGSGGSMTVLGTLDAGAELHVTNDTFDITLARSEGADGSVRYRWDTCSHDAFPFAQTLSLIGTAVDGPILAFDLPDVIAVGPDVVQQVPATTDLEAGILPQLLSLPLEWQWGWSAAFPSTSAGAVDVFQMFVLRNQRSADDQLLESLACMPTADGSLTVPAADLAQLTPDPGDDSTYATAQLDTYFSGVAAEAPWGHTLRAQSLISMSGLLRLSP
ncbi:MAG: hypothetical protein EXR71_15125 [Myxococcales bacterium]|nr:hypothetical protein [Myxococcales bacterium]